MNIPYFLALRYIKGNSRFFFNFWSLFSVLGIFFGVFAILVASSFMQGLQQVMIDTLLQKRAHITIKKKDNKPFGNEIKNWIKNDKRIANQSTVIYTQGVLKTEHSFHGVQVCGINLSEQKEILPFLKKLDISDLKPQQLIMSDVLQRDLCIANGKTIYLYSTQNTQTTAFGKIPVVLNLELVDTYNDSDDQMLAGELIYVNLSVAEKLSGNSSSRCIELHLVDAYQVKNVIKSLTDKFGKKYVITGWDQEDKAIYKSLKIEAIALNLVLFLIIILAIFNMSGNFLRLASEKSGEIGVLKAMGIRQNQVKKIFIYCGLFIAGVGAGLGVISAYVFTYVQHKYRLLSIPIQGLGFDYLPVSVNYDNGIYLFLVVLVVSVIFSYYPCKKLQSVVPIKVIKE